LEPYKIEEQSSLLELKEEIPIDLERERIAKMGLADSTEFDIDSNGRCSL